MFKLKPLIIPQVILFPIFIQKTTATQKTQPFLARWREWQGRAGEGEGRGRGESGSEKSNYKVMTSSHTQLELEWSSDQPVVPFIGKYHQVLRRRKQAQDQPEQPAKAPYRRKRISYKSLINMYQAWKVEFPLSENHVYNFHNILAINEHSMRNPSSDESFISSKFYMKKVKRVAIQRAAVLLTLEDVEMACTPIPYICERLKSMGDSLFLEMAQTIEHLEETLPEITRRLQREQEVDETELQGFLGEMRGKLFFSQYSPHLLVISCPLLQLLGYNVEEFALESIKHKSILYEFFSAEHYAGVILKHLENIKLLREYLQNAMTLEEFCQRSLMVYNDCLYNRTNRKIHCQFHAGTSKQLTPYIEVHQHPTDPNDAHEQRPLTQQMQARKQRIAELKEAHRSREIGLLKQLTAIPRQLDPLYKEKICAYEMLESLMEEDPH